ncbi:hypothetical protein GCM10023204_40750 [Actinomycetospora succinea]
MLEGLAGGAPGDQRVEGGLVGGRVGEQEPPPREPEDVGDELLGVRPG